MPIAIRLSLLVTITLGLLPVAAADEPTTRPASASTRPAGMSPAELAKLPPVAPDVEKILDRLEKRGETIRDIQADLIYVKKDPILEDKQTYKGELLFKQEEPNPRFMVRFDEFEQEGVVRKKKEWHAFDGHWYIEARENTKTIVRREIVPPGEQVEVFRVGQGPFPLPFGQSKKDIIRHFKVYRVPTAKGDPPNTDHLECIPRPGTEMDRRYGTVHFYIDRKLDLPVQVRTIEKEEEYEISATFPAESIRINQGLAASRINVPDLPGYTLDTVPLPDKRPTPPAIKIEPPAGD
jgi:hypothetical protein